MKLYRKVLLALTIQSKQFQYENKKEKCLLNQDYQKHYWIQFRWSKLSIHSDCGLTVNKLGSVLGSRYCDWKKVNLIFVFVGCYSVLTSVGSWKSPWTTMTRDKRALACCLQESVGFTKYTRAGTKPFQYGNSSGGEITWSKFPT